MPDPFTLDPGSTALLVMDYQPLIVDQLPDGEQLLERAATAVDAVRGRGGHVGWVRVAFTDADFDAIPETSTFARFAGGDGRSALHADAPGTQIHDRLDPRPEDAAVRKVRVGAFTTTDLHDQLRARGVTTLVIAGLSTSGVVLSTVREAMDRDYRTVVLRDACGDPKPGVHDVLTDEILAAHGLVTTVDGLDALWA
ncbi:cysteine hydrolase [Patulibacter sp. NPDC049589]|uniref:cysteine hydrolase family protein n=1 Tax=Patulibacter sp. NPDC049589 TaxID=3154731 RepID=UPI0034441A4B